ncbi:LarC family nickel insertion protein [Paracoccus albus]|uniref:LarC family nickel insertion protein n=1 Tax=Paracoccus albus TaxID=3017784 RepID=UPI0022F141EE|nr:LarC family nickel insertion protein [Paracoccus albus]WBU61504.1 LarC family nickel insertion protein [Paracoccus albus]
MSVEGARHLHLDPVGGIAGDMFVAALLDSAPELLPGATALATKIGPGISLTVPEHSSHGLRGRQLRLALPGTERGPRHYGDYLSLLHQAAPDPGTADRASDILLRLGEAEAKVHGVTLERVHFHEISDWDSIADILLAAWLIGQLRITSASVGTVPIGSGRIKTEHGIMPVPAPATAQLLQGFAVMDDGIGGERVTPTGAAILAHLGPVPRLPDGLMLQGIGYGFGTRQMPEIANMLRATLHEPVETAAYDSIGVITFQVDDQTPEDLAVGLEHLRSRSEVLEVLQFPCFGKKGRMAIRIEVLCQPYAVGLVADQCFAETTTIGLRIAVERRRLLPREAGIVRTGEHDFHVKRVTRSGGEVTSKIESDDLARTSTHAARQKLRRSLEADQTQQSNSGNKS